MNGSGRDNAPFSGRIWQEIDQTIASVRAANCTARRFLEVDGPYGPGLTSVAGEEGWLPPGHLGASPGQWNVSRPLGREWHLGDAPSGVGSGTYLVSGSARPVPMIASEFHLGMRAVEAYEAGCQPLDLCAATRAARDLALEEERLIYYGAVGDPQSLLHVDVVHDGEYNFTRLKEPRETPGGEARETIADEAEEGRALVDSLHEAIEALAYRGYAGPFALTVDAGLYTDIYAPNEGEDALRVDLIRHLFRGGIHLAPVIDPSEGRRGAIVTLGRAYSRLVVGQDWATDYRGRDGVLHRFLITSSLQFRVCDVRSIQVLVSEDWTAPLPPVTGPVPTITAIHDTEGHAITTAHPGMRVVIVGEHLGHPGGVLFRTASESHGVKAWRWSPRAIGVVVPAFWTARVDASVVVLPRGRRRSTEAKLTVETPHTSP